MGFKVTIKKIALTAIFLIALALITLASQFTDNTQTDFDGGTYTNTTYNGSAIILSGNNVSGTYTSQIFDASSDANWSSISWQGSNQEIEFLYAVDGSGAVYSSSDLGVTWIQKTSDYGRGSSTADMFSDDVYLYIIFSGTQKEVYRSTDGVTWNIINDTFTSKPLLVGEVDTQGNLYIATGPGAVWQSTDYGATWIEKGDFNGGATNDAKGIAINSSDDIFIVDGSGAVYQSSDQGQTWTQKDSSYGGGSSTDGMVVDSLGNLYILKDKEVWKSIDQGVNWNKISDPFTPYGNDGCVIGEDSNGNLYIADCTGRVFNSTDGLTWTEKGDLNAGASNNPRGLSNFIQSTNLTFQVRNCSSADCSDESWGSTNLSNLNLKGRYFQYKALFTTPHLGITPSLYNVTINYTLLNQQPTISSLTLTPSQPKTNNDLTCSFTITDQDADPLTANITWYKNSVVYSSITQSVTNGTESSSILDSSNTAKNQEWNCTIIPYDGIAYGTPGSEKVIIQNTAPIIGPIPDKSTDSQISWSYDANATDIDLDEGIDALTWTINNTMLDINSATGLISDTPLNEDEGTYIINVTASDGAAQDSTTFNYTITVNRAPNVTSITLTLPQPKTNDNLNCSFTITDDRLQQLTANITWYKNNVLNITDNISVTNGTQTITILNYQNTTKNQEWNCTITPYDNNSYGQKASQKVIIQNSPPTAPNISITPSLPITTDDLNVIFNTVSQDNDSDSIIYSYNWYKNSILQPGITGSTVSRGVTSKNELWLVNVTPNDGTENGEKDTASVTIQNSLPSITSASITPTTAYETTTLTASAEGWSDIDEESENYIYQWFNQNGKIDGAISPTLTGTNFNKTDQIYCNITPYDSDDYGTSKLTNTITILNSLPTLTANITTDLGYNGTDEDLIASFTAADADLDPITNNQTKWYKDSIEQTNLAGLITISYKNTSADEVWTFSARVYDEEEWSNWYNTSITILDISQTYPTLISPSNGTYFNVSDVVLTYTTPNYANMNCTIYADPNSNPITKIKNNTNMQTKTTIIYNWKNIADNTYYWKVGCTNDTILYNSTIKTFTVDTHYPVTAPTLTQLGVSDSDRDGNIELSWTADSDANTYNIYRSSTLITDAINLTKIASASSTSWEDNTTLHDNAYWYALTTVDRAGNENKSILSDSFNATANDTIKPKIPENPNASSLNGVTIIYWNKVTKDINENSDQLNLQYKIWYRQNTTVNLSKTLVNETADYIKTVTQDSCSGSFCSTTHSLSDSALYYYFITTIDDANLENLTLHNNYANVNATPSPPGTGGSGGGGGGGGGGSRSQDTTLPVEECKEDWSCSEWYSCVNGIQARNCIDINHCGTETNKPKETRPCQACQEKWQCGDWTPCVNNRQTRVCIDKNDCGTEKNKPAQERDCNLDTCSDGTKNYGEVGIDCGGPCRPCKASDFITGSAIRVKAAKEPNPFLLIPTIFLLIAFIILKTIRSSDVKFKRIVSAIHIPIIMLIIVLFIFSFLGPQITGLFTIGNETIKEEPPDITMESEAKGVVEIPYIDTIVKFDKTKTKITSTVFLIIISLVLISFIIKKKFSTKKVEEPTKLTKEQIDQIEKDIQESALKHPLVEDMLKGLDEEIKEPNKQEILSQIKEQFKLDQLK